MQFCGRAKEMELITDRWRRASDVENPDPQLVILKAERGIGKTRLALEFYRYLSETIDGVGREGYWPDAVEILDRSIDVNPDPDACRFNVPIPYLWWGLRAADKGAENGIAGDAIATYDKFLAPHLVALTMRARMIRSGKAILDVWRDVAVGEAANWSGYDTVISVGEGLLKTVGILRGSLGTAEGVARDELGKRSMGRVDAVMEDLESIFNPRSFTYAKTPGVILIDDAQFSADDPGLAVFAERLLHSAMTQSWPVLILVTHWKRDLSPEFLKVERSFAGILHHGRGRTPADHGPAAGLPGGFLNAENTLEIDLPIVPDLSEALREAFPGFLPEQVAALLNHSGGNPRHLEQIIAFLRENEDFFEDFDTKAALTEEGLAEALTETHDIFKVVMRRLRDAPQEVQEAICLASLHGVRFVSDTVDELARLHLGEARRDALTKASNPYSMISARRRERIAEFSERLFYMVAERRRRSLKALADGDALLNSLKTILRARLEISSTETAIEEQILTYGLAALTFSESDAGERHHLMLALARLAQAESMRYSYDAALLAASRFHDVYCRDPAAASEIEAEPLSDCATLLLDEGRVTEALEILRPLLIHHRDLAERLKTPESLRGLLVSLSKLGLATRIKGDHEAAAEVFAEALKIARDLEDRLKTPESLSDLSASLNEVGRSAQIAGDHEAAADAFAESLKVARNLANKLNCPESLRTLSISLNNVGSVADTLGKYAEAAEVHREMLVIASDLSECLKTPESLMDLLVSLNNMGWAADAAGDREASADAFQKGLKIARDLADRIKTPESLQRLSTSLINVGWAARVAGDHMAATSVFAESLQIARHLADRSKTHNSLTGLAASLEAVGKQAELEGNYEFSLEVYQEMLEITRDLARRLATPESVANLSTSLNCVGSVALTLGDRAAAANAFNEMLQNTRDLAKLHKTPQSFEQLCEALNNVGRMAELAGDYEAANLAYREGLAITRDLAKGLKTPQGYRGLSTMLNNVGRVAQLMGDHRSAFEAFVKSLDIRQALANHLNTTDSLEDLSASFSNVGRVAEVAGAHEIAREAFSDGLTVTRDLAKRLGTPHGLRALSASLNDVGRVAQNSENYEAAAEAFGESLDVARDLARVLETPESLRDLLVSLNNSASVAQVLGNHAVAADAYREALEVARGLVDRHKTPQSLWDLSVSLNNLGRVAQSEGDHAKAAEVFEESLTLARYLAEREKTSESVRKLCVILRLRCSLALLMSDNDRARLLLDEGETVLMKLPDLMRAQESAAFVELKTSLYTA